MYGKTKINVATHFFTQLALTKTHVRILLQAQHYTRSHRSISVAVKTDYIDRNFSVKKFMHYAITRETLARAMMVLGLKIIRCPAVKHERDTNSANHPCTSHTVVVVRLWGSRRRTLCRRTRVNNIMRTFYVSDEITCSVYKDYHCTIWLRRKKNKIFIMIKHNLLQGHLLQRRWLMAVCCPTETRTQVSSRFVCRTDRQSPFD